MANVDPAATELRRRAERIRRTARRLDLAELWTLPRRAGDDTWIGPSATRFGDDLRRSLADWRDGHDDLVRAALRLERTADEVERAALAALVTPPLGPR